MNKEDLYRNEGYWTSKIQLDLYNQLDEYMRVNNLNRSELAKQLKVTKGYISQVLNGDFNHRISKLVELSLAINKIPYITFIDVNNEIINASDGYSTKLWPVVVKNNQPASKVTETDHSEVSVPILVDEKSFYSIENQAI